MRIATVSDAFSTAAYVQTFHFCATRVAPKEAVFRPALSRNSFAGVSPEKQMATTYSELLKDPRWQKLRLKTLEAAGWKCEHCKNEEKTLNVHHRAYKSGAKPWDYEDVELQVLCETCHQNFHAIKKKIETVIGRLEPTELVIALGFVRTLALRYCCPADEAMPFDEGHILVGPGIFCSALDEDGRSRTKDMLDALVARIKERGGSLTGKDIREFCGHVAGKP